MTGILAVAFLMIVRLGVPFAVLMLLGNLVQKRWSAN